MTTIAQVKMFYKGTLIFTKKIKEKFKLGESPDCDFPFEKELSILYKMDGEWIFDQKLIFKNQLGKKELTKDLKIEVEVFEEIKNKYSISLDKGFLGYFLGSLVFSATYLVLLHSMPPESLSISADFDPHDEKYARFFYQKDFVKEDKPEETSNQNSLENSRENLKSSFQKEKQATSSGKKYKGSGKASNFSSQMPSMERRLSLDEAARNAGILGILSSQGDFISPGSFQFHAEDSNDSDIWNSVTGIGYTGEFTEGLSTGFTNQIGGTANGVQGLGKEGLINPNFNKPGGEISYTERKKSAPRISVGNVESKGLDKDLVRRIVRAHINEIRSCYNKALTVNPHIEGRVFVQFTILNTGKVSSVIIKEDSTKNADLTSCITRAIKRWRFPTSKGISIVSYPFVLRKF